jgi:acetolactate synthase-1/2/3 large subunit
MDTQNCKRYGSDLMAEIIANLDIPYIALNPGASFRGLHDSLVNHPTRRMPELITCTHEEISVGVAHGYAKATGKPMAAAIHNLVGLQHASMAIFNAWCDRTPMFLFGGGGPMEVEKRRPGTDWIHTAQNQADIIRNFVKWDDQPASLYSLTDSIYRAYRLSVTEPAGPVYVCFDAGLQEEEIYESELHPTSELMNPPELNSYLPGTSPAPDSSALEILSEAILIAKWPVIVTDYTGRSDDAFYALSILAQEWAIPVLDLGNRLNLPTTHPMNLTGANFEVLERADVVIALDIRDLHGTVSRIDRTKRTIQNVLKPNVRVFSISLQDYLTRSWAADYQRMYPVERSILADTKLALPLLYGRLQEKMTKTMQEISSLVEIRRQEVSSWHKKLRKQWIEIAEKERSETPIASSVLASELWNLLKDEDFIIANGKLSGWVHRIFNFEKPRQYLGVSGGGGLGYGIGATIGACLAHRETDKLVVNIQSDGDLLFTPGGLWTLAHHDLPALIVMFNNRSYYNSEEHQINTAKDRGRDVKRAGIGTHIDNPSVDFAKLAESMGVLGIGPIERVEELQPTLAKALDIVLRERRSVLIDIVTQSK